MERPLKLQTWWRCMMSMLLRESVCEKHLRRKFKRRGTTFLKCLLPRKKMVSFQASILWAQEKATNSSTPNHRCSSWSVESFQIKTYLTSWCHGAWVLMRKERQFINMPELWVLWRECRPCCGKDYGHCNGWSKMWGWPLPSFYSKCNSDMNKLISQGLSSLIKGTTTEEFTFLAGPPHRLGCVGWFMGAEPKFGAAYYVSTVTASSSIPAVGCVLIEC